MKNHFLAFFLFAITFSACKKSEPNGVMISIENNTSFTLDSVQLVFDPSHYNFGTILSGKATGYMFFKSMVLVPAVTADSANKKIFAGQMFPPPPFNSTPYVDLANGKYTLEMFPDTTLFYHYQAKFIKN